MWTRSQPPEAPKDEPPGTPPYPPPQRPNPSNRQPAPRRGIVKPETPGGCAYYLLLLTWCIAAFVRHTDAAGPAGSTWNTATGVMFAIGVGLVVTGGWSLLLPPRDLLQGGWITVIGGLAITGALWGGW